MYKCSICGNHSEPGETQHKVVVATRMHDHPPRDDAYPRRMTATGEKVARDDPGGRGPQIEREVNACSHCALMHKHSVVVPVNGVGLRVPTFSMAPVIFDAHKEA